MAMYIPLALSLGLTAIGLLLCEEVLFSMTCAVLLLLWVMVAQPAHAREVPFGRPLPTQSL
jgi:hypothetical protein